MNKRLYFNTLVAALGGFLFGFDTAVISGTISSIKTFFVLDDVQLGWAVSAALIGCIAGAFFAGKPADYFGRKKMLISLALVYLISALGSGLAQQFITFVIFRIIGGVAVGASSVLAPMFISEISPPQNRGKLTMSFQLLLVIGILIAFFSNYLIASSFENSWRWMLLAEALPATLFLILAFFLEQSPRWLVKVKNFDKALLTIQRLNPNENAKEIINEIKTSLAQEIGNKQISVMRKPFIRLISSGFLVGMFNQLTGINVIMYYAPIIFQSAGFSDNSSLIQTVIIGATNLLFTVMAMILIDRVGRKFLLLTGAAGMSVFLGLFSYMYIHGTDNSYFLLVSLVGFIVFFASSQGAVIWVLLAEMFPNIIRARGASVGSFSHWIFNFFIALGFPVVSAKIGIGFVFIFFTFSTVVSFFFYQRFIKETKGKSLEEIEREEIIKF